MICLRTTGRTFFYIFFQRFYEKKSVTCRQTNSVHQYIYDYLLCFFFSLLVHVTDCIHTVCVSDNLAKKVYLFFVQPENGSFVTNGRQLKK